MLREIGVFIEETGRFAGYLFYPLLAVAFLLTAAYVALKLIF